MSTDGFTDKSLPENRRNTSSFYKAIIILTLSQRHYKKMKLQTNISHEHRYNDPQKHISKLKATIYKREICIMTK